MSRLRFSSSHLAEFVAWAAFAVCLRYLFSLFETNPRDGVHLFNSDALFLADLLQDIRHGGRLSEWNLPHAVFLVPDFALWGLTALLAPSLQWTMILYGAIQAFVGAWLTRSVVVREYGQPMGGLAPAAYCLVFAFLSRGQLPEALDIIKPLHHYGVALTALAALWLLSAWFTAPRWSRLALLASLLGVGCLSDPFTVTCAAIPVLGVLAVALVRSPAGRKENLIALVAVGAATFVGTLAARALTEMANDVGQIRLQGIAGQWALLQQAFGTLELTVPDVLGVIGLAAAAVFFVRGIVRMCEPGLGATLDLAPGIAAGANLSALMITGNVVHVLFNRYQIVIFALLILTLVRATASLGLLFRRPQIGARAITSLGTLIALCAALWMTHRQSALPRVPLPSWRPPGTECLVDAAAQHDALRGIGDFWNARLYSMLNGEGLRVEQVDGHGLPHRWLNTTRPYAEAKPPIAFAMISRLNTTSLEQTYGAPAAIVSCGDEVIWFWDPPRREIVTRAFNAARPK